MASLVDLKLGRIFQINLSDGGLPKLACQLAEVTSLGLVGDRQEETDVHGGPDRAICLFSLERILALQAEAHPIFPGAIGENLTLFGVDWELMLPGARLRLGETVFLELTRYTTPCHNLIPYFIDGDYSRVAQKRHPGWSRLYARVLQVGRLQVGDRVSIGQVSV
jgi:MOSC domain-containing protein YiiM